MKKKWYVIVPIVAALGAGGFFIFRAQNGADPAPQVTNVKVERGTVRAVVNSTGRVVANLDVDIKCKASGEVMRLPLDVSNDVRKNDLLMELDPIDQQRIVDQAQVALQASQARLASAEQNLKTAEWTLETDRTKAKSALRSAEVKAKDARAKAERTKQLFEKKLSSQEELDTAETTAVQAEGDLLTAQVKLEELKTQEGGLEVKRQDVELAKADKRADEISLKVATDRFKDTTVVAPMDGVVSARTVQIGTIITSGTSTVGGGTTILTLSDLSRLFVYASVDESDIGRVHVGQDVNITADAFPGRTFRGKVVLIATKGTNTSNVVTFEVRIEVIPDAARDRASRRAGAGRPEGSPSSQPSPAAAPVAGPLPPSDPPPGTEAASRPASAPASQPESLPSQHRFLLKPEMTANVEIVISEANDVLTVPVEAIVRKSGGVHVVTVVKDDGTTEERTVESGVTDGVKTEISSGLKDGETVRKGTGTSKWTGQRQQGRPAMGFPMGGGRGR